MEQDDFPYGNDFEWEERIFLGQGSYGKVFKVRNFKDNQFYAIKQMNMECFNKDPVLMKSLKGQIAITSDVSSDHTVKMVTYQMGQNFTYIILELCDSDLRKQICNRKFTQQECIKVFQDVIMGFQVLVSKGYIHRDIKPANVLVKNKRYKIADFGFACKADILGRQRLTDICGTPIYMAPQLLRNQSYTAKSDIWSLGLMLYEMVFGYPPWPCRSMHEYLNAVLHTPLKFPYNAKIGVNTKDFIKRSLVHNEDRRMSWKEVFEHPLVRHQDQGAGAPSIEVDEYVKKILLRIQNEIQARNLNVNDLLRPYHGMSISQPSLYKLIRDITPAITTHEVNVLFNYLDKQKQGHIESTVIEDKIFHVDFRQSDDLLSRKIEELAAILKARNEHPAIIFQKIDANNSGFIDYSEFSIFLKSIAPRYKKFQRVKFFQLFDADSNGLISKDQFLQMLLNNFPNPNKESVATERAKRNMSQFVEYLKWSSVSPTTFIKIADKDKDGQISMNQFNDLLNNKLSFNITFDEVNEVFKLIDTDRTGTISVKELTDLMK